MFKTRRIKVNSPLAMNTIEAHIVPLLLAATMPGSLSCLMMVDCAASSRQRKPWVTHLDSGGATCEGSPDMCGLGFRD